MGRGVATLPAELRTASPGCTIRLKPGSVSRWTAPWWCDPGSRISAPDRSPRSRQIAAELLGVGLDDVTVIYNSDSAVTTPLAGTTTATRALYMTGNAVTRLAAEGGAGAA